MSDSWQVHTQASLSAATTALSFVGTARTVAPCPLQECTKTCSKLSHDRSADVLGCCKNLCPLGNRGPHTDTHTRARAHTRTDTYTHTQTHTDTHRHTHTHADTHRDTHTHTRVEACLSFILALIFQANLDFIMLEEAGMHPAVFSCNNMPAITVGECYASSCYMLRHLPWLQVAVFSVGFPEF